MAWLSNAQQQSERGKRGFLAAIALGMALVVHPPVGMAVDAESAYKLGQESYQRNDWVGAIAHLRSAAEAQHVPSMVMLAYVLDRAEEDTEAMQWYRKAAMLNSAEGALGLGEMLAESADGKKNPAEALEWITRAAKLGHHPAMFRMAMLHQQGGLGVTVNPQETQKWLEMAAKDGFVPAVKELEKLRGLAADNKGVVAAAGQSPAAPAAGSPGPQKEVEAVIQQWARAWSDKDLTAYRAFYATTVQPPPAFNSPEKMGPMVVSEVQVVLLEEGKARAMFKQQIQSGGGKEAVRKALSINKEGTAWKIVKEEGVP